MKRLREKIIDGERVEFSRHFRIGAWSFWNGEPDFGPSRPRRRAHMARARWEAGRKLARHEKITREEVGPEPGKGPTSGKPRCHAHWEVPGPNGKPIGSKERGCMRLATMDVDTSSGGPLATYCPWHGEDRKRIEAERKAADKAARELHDRKWHHADEFAGGLPETPGTSKGTGKRPPPTGCKVVHAIKCACGSIVDRSRFPDHYAACEETN